MSSDLFDQLDKELSEMEGEIQEAITPLNSMRGDIIQALIEDFWKIWIRFKRINIHFSIEPNHSTWAVFEDFPEEWAFREGFHFADINQVELIDRTQDQGRVGDSIKAFFYTMDGALHLRVVCEYCEGEHYYKYSGWKRIFSQQILYDAPLDKINMEKMWAVLPGVIKVWFESHLRKDRDLIIKYVKENFEKGETFTQ